MSRFTLTQLTAAGALLLFTAGGGSFSAYAQSDVTQPGDSIIASSSNSPGSEGVANAIDGKQTKYLNFDLDNDATGGPKPAGFVVTPSVGVTRVTGMALMSANDAADRDPKTVKLEGSNDDTIADFNSGTWEVITTLDNIPSWTSVFGDTDNRFKTQVFEFTNVKAYKHYRWTVTQTQGPSTCCLQIAEVELLGSVIPGDVTQPGDTIVASSSNSPGSEGVANAIDGKQTKYLNFDLDNDATGGPKPAGFIVTPSVGDTVVTGMTLMSANDAADRDPKVVKLEGSNDETIADFNSGTWELIVQLDAIPSWASVFGDTDNRFKTQMFLFDNFKPYKHYRWTTLATQGPSTCCLQIAEVELLGTGAPQDVTQPGDTIIASSSNSPGSEGVANAIDGKQTKYLNFDLDNDATGGPKPAGFVVTPSIGASTVTGMSLMSANDAADRDPKVVKLEGSNDDTIADFNSGTWEQIVLLDNIPSWTSVFGDTDNRFKTQKFFFKNAKSYKHYRWTVTATQGPSTCCLQIAEVELLAATSGADCNKAAFLVQPVDTPVLAGSSATFYTIVNGPWPVLWYMNGQPIPGANETSYTTEPITEANATNVYSVQIVGCEMSTEVKANIFTPSSLRSIGISFDGGGANGSPTVIRTNDIAGVHPQAYWVNATASSGSLPDYTVDPAVELFDSSNKVVSDITVEFATGGEWGAGTGDADPTQRLLNGMVHTDNSGAAASTFTFHGVPSGQHTVIAYTVGIPLQFQNADYTIKGQSSQTIYVRVMNSDEYNPAPGYYRGISTDAANRSLASYVRFDNVRADANGDIILEWVCKTTGYDRGVPLNAIQLILNAPAAGAPPTITTQPQPAVALEGGTARLSVTATGDNLTYQWRKNGRNLPNGGNVSGATTSTLTLRDFSADDVGVYNVAIFNAGGSTISANASAALSKFDINDGLVAYFKFDESSGTTAANAVSGGKAATYTGTPSWVTGQIGKGLGFDGTAYAVVDDYTKTADGLSASVWVKADAGLATDAVIARNAQGAFDVGTDSNPILSGQFEIGLDMDDATGALTPYASIRVGPNIITARAPTALTAGTWTHVAFTADGAQLRLFINGTQADLTDYLGNVLSPVEVKYLTFGSRLDNNADAGIGPDTDAPNLLVGQIDDFGIWTRALSATEVSKINTAGKAGAALDTVKIEAPSSEDVNVSVARDGANIVISWPADATGFVLESSDAIAPANWTAVTGVTGNSYTVTPTGSAKFYRLRK